MKPKLDEKKSKHANLVQQNDICLYVLNVMKSDLIVALYFQLTTIMIGLRSLLLTIFHLFVIPNLVLWVRMGKKN
jgi:hypothetical protein